MSPKIIATDLDGTLFYPKHPFNMISKKNLKFLRERIDRGDKVVVVSGRNHGYGKKVETVVGRQLDFVNCNGAYIKVDGKVIQNEGLDTSIVEVYEELNKMFKIKVSTIMSEDYSLLINPGEHHRFFKTLFVLFYSFQGIYKENYLLIDDNAELAELKEGKVYKFMLFFGFSRKGKRMAIEAHEFLKKNFPMVESAFTGSFLEITPRHCVKAEGLKKICEYYKADPKDVYVIGDSGNDITMFDAFYDNSFCMRHAVEHVRCHAKHTIRRVNCLDKYLD